MEANERAIVAQEIVRTMPAVMRTVTTELRHKDYRLVPAQLVALSVLAEQSCNLSQLAEANNVSLPTMSGTISKLVAQGWVKRTRSQQDRRMILLELTEEGQAYVKEIGGYIVAQLAELLKPLSREELTAVNKGLSILQKIFPPIEPVQDNNKYEKHVE